MDFLSFSYPTWHGLGLPLDKNSDIPFFQILIPFQFLLAFDHSLGSYFFFIFCPEFIVIICEMTHLLGTKPLPLLKPRSCDPR